MKSRKLEDWLQIIGLFGVIGSLIFVGLQMKQDRDIALSEIWQARTAAVVEQTSSVASNEIVLSALAKSTSGRIAEITPVENEAGLWMTFGSMYLWENSHYQYSLGFLPDEHWNRVREGIKIELQNPFLGPLMLDLSKRMRPSFRTIVEEINRELTAEKN
jgi:hypothetical protein